MLCTIRYAFLCIIFFIQNNTITLNLKMHNFHFKIHYLIKYVKPSLRIYLHQLLLY
jgi:hypothetical protein